MLIYNFHMEINHEIIHASRLMPTFPIFSLNLRNLFALLISSTFTSLNLSSKLLALNYIRCHLNLLSRQSIHILLHHRLESGLFWKGFVRSNPFTSTNNEHLYFKFLELWCSVIDNINFQIMFQKIQIILHPFLAFRFQLFKWVELDFILSCSNVLSFDVVFLGKLFEPQSGPHKTDVSNHGHGVYINLIGILA